MNSKNAKCSMILYIVSFQITKIETYVEQDDRPFLTGVLFG